MNYEVRVKTADQADAGTDSNLFLRLIGVKGSSGEIRMNAMLSGDAFERGDLDRFSYSGDLGGVYSIQLRSQNDYAGAGWRPDYIEVESHLPDIDKVVAKFDFDEWIEDTKTRTKTWSGYKLSKLGTESFRIFLSQAQLVNNYHSDQGRSESIDTVTTTSSFVREVIEELESTDTTAAVGVEVQEEASLSLPIKKLIKASIKNGYRLSSSFSEEAKRQHQKTVESGSSFEQVETVIKTENIRPNTYKLALHKISGPSVMTAYKDGVGGFEGFVALGKGFSAELQSEMEFPNSTGPVPRAEYELFKNVWTRQSGGDATLLGQLKSFEETAKKEGWIAGL